MKRIIVTFSFVFLFLLSVFADKSYSIKIVNADTMETDSNTVVLEGNVELSFSTTEDGTTDERSLKCSKVVINLDDKILQASGDVELTQDDDSSFNGSEVILNWDTLDVVVFGGKSSSIRNSSDGTDVEFFATGDRMSYSGDLNTVYFEDGVVSTTEEDPYWSITAKEIGLFDSDMFFRKAWLRLGRVPLLYLPFFFYPGNTLSFNPAVGFSSSKGAFLNTTFEIYGTYSGTKNKSSSDSAATAVLSFLETEDTNKKIRNGWIYEDMDYETLSDLQKWAYDTSSYFAVFADVYAEKGASIGIDTSNSFFDKTLKSDLTALVAKTSKDDESTYGKVRYSLDFTGQYSKDKTSVKISIPFMSDPDVNRDFLNRNTVFSFDSIFGSTQDFPTTFSSDYDYSWKLEASTSYTLGNITFALKDLDVTADFDYSYSDKKFSLDEAVLPYASASISGTIVDIKGSSKTVVEKEAETRDTSVATVGSVSAYPVPLASAETKTISGGSFKMDFQLNGSYKDVYSSSFVNTSKLIAADGKINFTSSVPGQWLNVTETISGSYTMNDNTYSSTTGSEAENGKISSGLTLYSQKLGLTYRLDNRILYYSDSSDGSESTLRLGNWDSDDVIVHKISFSKTIGDFSLSVSKNLKPLNGTINPSIGFSKNGYSVSAGTTIDPEDEEPWKTMVSELKVGVSKKLFSFNVTNAYDFETGGWEGYTIKESFRFDTKIFEKAFSFTESLEASGKFNVEKLQLYAGYDSNSVSMSFSEDENSKISPDTLKVIIGYDHDPKYLWKNRIGFQGSADGTFIWDFNNKYASSLTFDLSMEFGISEFFDLKLSMKTANTSFYNYYDDEGKFSFKLLFDDLIKSFDIINGGNRSTGFNISSFNLSAVHYMEDWNLYFNASAVVSRVSEGVYTLIPEASVIVKWNLIPELKVKNNWSQTE